MLEITLLCEYPTISGGENSMLSTLAVLRRGGCTLRAIAPDTGKLAERFAAEGVEVTPFSRQDGSGQAERRERLAELLQRRRPDLLHANSLSMARLSGPVAESLDLPSLGHLRDIVRLGRQAIDDVNRHRRLLAVSGAVRDYHIAAGLDADRTRVLHNGVDLERFHPSPASGELHGRLGLPVATPLIGAIGQIGLRKGFDVLATAAEEVCRRHADVHFVVAGERWSEKAESRRFEVDLRRATEATGGRWHLIGRCDDIPALLADLTLLAHPARQEPLGRVLLEAAAIGLPVVATDVGGTREIFPPSSGSARLVQPDHPTELAEVLLELLGDPAGRDTLSRKARRRAEEAFDHRVASQRLLEHYQEVAAL